MTVHFAGQDRYYRVKNVPSPRFHAYHLAAAAVVVSIAVVLHALEVPGARGPIGLEPYRVEHGPTLLLAGAGGTQAPVALVHETLANGVRLVIKPDASVPVVTVRALWAGGLRLEDPAESGITSLLAGAVTGGCEDRNAAALARRVSEMAGVLAGVVGRNVFGLRAEWPATYWREGLALMADCIRAPRFEAGAVARAKRRLLDAVRSRARSPRLLAFRTFAETLYPGHPYSMDPAGTAASVTALGRRQVASFYRRNFPLSELTLVIVGDIEPAQVVAQARRLFADEAAGDRPAGAGADAGADAAAPARAEASTDASGRVPRNPRPVRAREAYRYLAHGQAHVVIGFPGTTVGDPNRFALKVLATVLGGPGGRLEVELRERRALAHRVGAVSVEGVERGYLAVHVSCRPELLAATVRSVRAELARMVAEPVSDEALARAKGHLIDLHTAARRQHAAQAAALAFHEVYGLELAGYLGYEDRIRAVDASDLQHIAAAYIDWDEAVTATVKPPDASPEAARRARGVTRRVKRHRPRRAPREGRAARAKEQ